MNMSKAKTELQKAALDSCNDKRLCKFVACDMVS